MAVINLQLTPALTHWLPRIAACADPIPNIGVYLQILPQEELSLEEIPHCICFFHADSVLDAPHRKRIVDQWLRIRHP